MNTDIQKLKTALLVYEKGNYSDAAEIQNFTPSAISKQIASLENDLDTTLFIRHGKGGVTATPDAELLMASVKQLVDDFDVLENKIKKIKLGSSSFVLGVRSIFPAATVALFIEGMTAANPAVQVEVHRPQNIETNLPNLLKTGQLDAALIPILGDSNVYNNKIAALRDRGLTVIPLFTEQEYFLLNENHPLANQNEIRIEDIIEDPRNTFAFINTNPGTNTDRMDTFTKLCKTYCVKRATAEIPYDMGVSMDMLRLMICANRFMVSSVPYSARSTKGIVKKKCPNSPFNARILLCYSKLPENTLKDLDIAVNYVKKAAAEMMKRYE